MKGRSMGEDICGFCLCTFHIEHGQTVSWVYPRDALSKKDASVIAVNSFPDTSSRREQQQQQQQQQQRRQQGAQRWGRSQKINDAAAQSTVKTNGIQTTTKLMYCFRQPRDVDSDDGELCTPFVPLVGIKTPRASEANAGNASDDSNMRRAKNGDASSSDHADWLYCWVMHEVSRRANIERGAVQRSFVVFGSSPTGAIYETAARELVRRGIVHEIQRSIATNAPSSPAQLASSSVSRLEHELERLRARMLEPLSPSQAPQPVLSLVYRGGHAARGRGGDAAVDMDTDPVGEGDDNGNAGVSGCDADDNDDVPALRVVLKRIAPIGSGGWSGSVGCIGPTARLCRASDIAAGAGTWILSRGGLYQSLRGRMSALLPKLWLLWELMLVGEPLLVLSTSPETSAAAVVALAGILAPLPALADYRPYITIQDPLHHALSTGALKCEGRVMGATNAMMLQTLPISNVLSLSSASSTMTEEEQEEEEEEHVDHKHDGDEDAADEDMGAGHDVSSEEAETELTLTDEKEEGNEHKEEKGERPPPLPVVTANRLQEVRADIHGILSPPASPRTLSEPQAHSSSPAPGPGPGSRSAGADRRRVHRDTFGVVAGAPLKEGLHTKVRGVLRPCSKTLDLLIAADALASNPDSFRAACLANDAKLSAYFCNLTTRFLEPLRSFCAITMVKLERSQPFSSFPALVPLTAESAIDELEHDRRASFLVSGSEFPVSLYRRFLLGCNGRRWLDQTRRSQWSLALTRWATMASTKQCFAKMREIDVVSRANILSRLKAEVADKLASRLINEREAMELCQLCTEEVIR